MPQTCLSAFESLAMAGQELKSPEWEMRPLLAAYIAAEAAVVDTIAAAAEAVVEVAGTAKRMGRWSAVVVGRIADWWPRFQWLAADAAIAIH